MNERPAPDERPSSDPEVGAPGTDIHDFEQDPRRPRRVFDAGVEPNPADTDPEGDHEKRRDA